MLQFYITSFFIAPGWFKNICNYFSGEYKKLVGYVEYDNNFPETIKKMAGDAQSLTEEDKKNLQKIAKGMARDVFGLTGEDEKNLQKTTQKMVRPEIKKLKEFIKRCPRSVWADDAQFIIAYLTNKRLRDTHKAIREIESLFSKYPDFQIEDWTRENIPPIIPKDDLISIYRTISTSADLYCQQMMKHTLFYLYGQTGNDHACWRLAKEILDDPDVDESEKYLYRDIVNEFRRGQWYKRQQKQKDFQW